MDAVEIKKQISALPFLTKAVATGAIVDQILDHMAAGDPIDSKAMAGLIADMIRFTEIYRDRIERHA